MKPGVSTLNPYAAAYIPLAKRDSQPTEITQNQHYRKDFLGAVSHPTAEKLGQDIFSTKSQSFQQGSYSGSSQNASEAAEKEIMDFEFDEVLAYLQMTFPGLSEQSLADVYLANKGDIHATVDMLDQLEPTYEYSEGLPDTLDIGDVSEPGSSSHCAPLKLKNVSGAAEGSTESADSKVVS